LLFYQIFHLLTFIIFLFIECRNSTWWYSNSECSPSEFEYFQTASRFQRGLWKKIRRNKKRRKRRNKRSRKNVNSNKGYSKFTEKRLWVFHFIFLSFFMFIYLFCYKHLLFYVYSCYYNLSSL
jgi:hypothetical protein